MPMARCSTPLESMDAAMTDSRLRELECRWRSSGSVEDEATFLRERVRVGDLTRERLELAAYCDHGGAIASIDSPLRSPAVLTVDDFKDRVRALSRWGRPIA